MKLIVPHFHNIIVNFRWYVAIVILSLFLLSILLSSSCAQETLIKTKRDAFQILGEEQSMAENYLHHLKEFRKEDLKKYENSIKLYCYARAKFNEMIGLVKYKLIKEKSFDNSVYFVSTLRTAVDKRISFTTYMSEEIIGDRKDKKGFPPNIIKDAAELIEALTESEKMICQEYRSLNNARRKELLGQLDSLKWKAFHEIGDGN